LSKGANILGLEGWRQPIVILKNLTSLMISVFVAETCGACVPFLSSTGCFLEGITGSKDGVGSFSVDFLKLFGFGKFRDAGELEISVGGAWEMFGAEFR